MSGSWSLEVRKLPLKVNWSISRGSISEKENIFITFRDDKLEGMGEVAFITKGELSLADVEEAFEQFKEIIPSTINGLDHLTALLGSLELPSALRFAIESAYVHYLSQVMESTRQRVLGVREVSKILTSHSVPIMPVEEIGSYLKTNNLTRFHSLKVKVGKFDDHRVVEKIAELYKGAIRIDGNEAFSEAKEVLSFCEALKSLPIEFLEQPLAANNHEEAFLLREQTKVMLIADESVQSGPIVDDFQKMFHGVNIKLMKAGGYIKAMNQLREARALGLKTMLGCMIETSLGISSAMNIAHGVDFFDLDGFLFLEKDPFNLIYEENGVLYYSYNL